jgi:hypothetical protein
MGSLDGGSNEEWHEIQKSNKFSDYASLELSYIIYV